MFKGLEKVFDIIGEILAVLLILVFFVDMLNVQFGFCLLYTSDAADE